MKKRKLQQGPMITSLDHLARCEWVIVKGKPYYRGWATSWPLRLAKQYIDSGQAYEGIRLTNGQYYHGITQDKAALRFSDELHRLSPCRNGGDCPIAGECTENHCWKSFVAWEQTSVS